MTKSLVISERDNIAAVQQDNKVVEFFIHRGDMLLGDVYLASVENILPSIDAAFVNLGGDRMGFLHASDVIGKGALKDKLQPKQKILVQIMKEPTGHKGPRVTTQISLPGRFLVLMPDEKGINVSRKIVSAKERARLKSVVSLLKPAGVGVIIRTEAENQSEQEIQEDIEFLMEKWSNIVTAADTVEPPNLLYRDQDLLYRVIREACTDDVKEIIVDTPFALHRTNQLLQSWNMGNGINVSVHKGNDSVLMSRGIDKEIRNALQTKVNLPSGGYLYIQTTEALTVVDVNSGKFTSSATQNETIRKTNLESVAEIARQLRLRNIGGMIIIDFIDMENRVDKLAILEELELALEPDKAKPQVGQLSDLGLVELTRHRQGQSLAEIFTKKCPACNGTGSIIEELNFVTMPTEGDFRTNKNQQKIRMPQKVGNPQHSQNSQPIQQQQQKQLADKAQKVEEKQIKVQPSANAQQQSRHNRTNEQQQRYYLNEPDIKQYMAKVGTVPAYSKLINFATVPSRVARRYLNQNYIVDVFTILREMETAEEVALKRKEQIENNEIKEVATDEITKVDEIEQKDQVNEDSVESKIEEVQQEEQPIELIDETLSQSTESQVGVANEQEESSSEDEKLPEKPLQVTEQTQTETEEKPKASRTRRTTAPKAKTTTARRGRPKTKKTETEVEPVENKPEEE